MIITLDTAPASEPLSLDEAKDHLRVDTTDDDTYIQALIAVARQQVEDITKRALVTQTWDLYRDRFPWGDNAMEIPKAPLQSVSSIAYVDENGTTQTWAASNYTVDADSEPGRIYLAYNKSWPSIRDERKSVHITFVAGYGGAEDVPDAIKQAMLLLIGHLYENREIAAPVKLEEVPMAFNYLVSPYKVWTL